MTNFPKPFFRPSSKQGFALVIALGLMAFVLLLLLSITTLVQVETQGSAIAMAQLEARENARLAAMQALGNLQKSMGPDQRVSFNAATFDADPNTPDLDDVANPLWVAAVRTVPDSPTANAELFPENNRREILGFDTNDKVNGVQLPGVDRADTIEWLVSSTRPQAAPSARIGPSAPIESDAAGIMGGAENVVEIASRKYTHFGSDPDAPVEVTVELPVEAGLVPVASPSGSKSGRFAWWIEDEGLKAQFNRVDEDPALANTVAEAPFDKKLFPLLQGRQSNFAKVSAATPAFDELVNQELLQRLGYESDLSELSEDWAKWFADRSADIGFGSYGLPVDVVEGRLKQDLTVYLETGEGLNDSDDILRGGSGDTTYSGTPNYLNNFSNLPKFGVLRGWHELGKETAETTVSGGTITNPSLVSRPQTETEHGFHPNVWRAGVLLQARIKSGTLPTADTGPLPVEVELTALPIVELWNPYSVPIPAEKYLVEIAMPDRYQIYEDGTPAPILEFDFLQDGMLDFDPYAFGGNRGWIRMVIDTGDRLPGQSTEGIMPGESVLFTSARLTPTETYVSQPADAFNSETDDNYSGRNPSGTYFHFPLTKTMLLQPRQIRDDEGNLVDNPQAVYMTDVAFLPAPDNGIYHRISRLRGAGPILLAASDPLQSFNADFRNQRRSQGMGYPTPDFPSSYGPKRYLRVARAAAMSGAARHGGDRKVTHRNPRLGFLRPTLAPSGWNDPNHINQPFFQDPWSHAGPRWRIGTSPWGNSGMLDGYGANDYAGNIDYRNSGTVAAHYDFPRRYGPIHSLGQLMHANLNPVPFGPSYVVGYSRPPAAIFSREKLRETANTLIENERVDLAYLVNASLWDRFYLSTIPQSGTFDPADRDQVLPNNQLRIVPSGDKRYPAASAMRNSAAAFEQSAANVLVEGAFNVNSTSVEAWYAFLLTKAGLSMEPDFPASGIGGNKNSFDQTYNNAEDERIALFPRFAEPVFGLADYDAFTTGDPRADMFYRAGLHITHRESLRRLAAAIVAEIKRRGPFLSMADFINRRLISDKSSVDGDYMGLMGTLDAAIHRVSQEEGQLNHQLIFGSNDPHGTSLPDTTSTDLERSYAVPQGTNESALEGFASYLMQGDILANIGSSLTVRSDTFTIHGYGRTEDPLTGQMISEARCELVVQRVAEPVQAGDSIVRPTGDFGRRFEIIDFRWIN